MTISWGTKLLIVFGLFAGNISYMVYRCSNVDPGLVSNEYYKDELAYQKVIDGTNLANALTGDITLLNSNGNIIIQLPAEMKKMPVTGSMLFYCPSNGHDDRKIILNVDGDGRQVINARQFAHGKYVIKITWDAQNKHYYNEQSLTI